MSSSPHAIRTYLPLPQEQRRGIALCFSGGGYRAALFHLGAIRRLNELGLLSRIDTVTSVSGGSILAAAIAYHRARAPDAWGDPGTPVAGFDAGIAGPMRELTTRDIRSRAVLARLKPWNWLRQNAQIDVLASELEGPTPVRLADLPPRPRFVFCSTDVCFRAQWTFDTGAGALGEGPAGHGRLDGWSVAQAAAASSCLPGAFAPMRFAGSLEPGDYSQKDRDALVSEIDLSDGGVYDNLGLEPVWRDHATVLVSDASPAFKPKPRMRLWKELRYAVTLLEQATDVRKRWLISSLIGGELDGAYWGIASLPDHYDADTGLPVYPPELIRDFISQIRIDLDPFSTGERAVLENHGYMLAEVALKRHAPSLYADGTPPRVPFPDWVDPKKAQAALEDSDQTRLFARSWKP